MNGYNLPGVEFRPITYKPYYAVYKGEVVNGVHIYITDKKKIKPTEIQFYFLEAHNKLYPDKNIFKLSDKNRLKMFDKVAGSDNVRKLISKRFKYDDLKTFFDKDIEKFRRISKKFYLYD
jgi:uncharacterized protein YbbC (DUF1343 family)